MIQIHTDLIGPSVIMCKKTFYATDKTYHLKISGMQDKNMHMGGSVPHTINLSQST